MQALVLAILALALLGHAAFWVGLVNRWHAVGLPRSVVKGLTLLLYLPLVALPPVYAWHVYQTWPAAARLPADLNAWTVYAAFCAAFGLLHLGVWAIRRRRAGRLPASVRRAPGTVVHVPSQLGHTPAQGLRTQVFSRIPYNQLWHLHVEQFTVELDRLAEGLEGLSVCHWSDLHMSGRIGRSYFEHVVELTNEAEVDVLALTGDICDTADCIGWIAETLGPARARLGKYFILGNHDLRTRDVGRLCAAMREAGFEHLGGRGVLAADSRILIAGDERPWFAAGADGCQALLAEAPHALRILLSHTPDHVGWARRQGFDLMLAGHTHGGQIRFPLVGPIFCPSWHGVKYAGGFFDESPTMLHVSRGTASLMPLRINCPPEMTKLVLCRRLEGSPSAAARCAQGQAPASTAR